MDFESPNEHVDNAILVRAENPGDTKTKKKKKKKSRPMVRMDTRSIMAAPYIPRDWRLVPLLQVTSTWPTQQPPGNLVLAQELFSKAVPYAPVCFCGDKTHRTISPWMNLPVLPWNPYFALSPAGAQRRDSEFRREFPSIEHVQSQNDYVLVFTSLLKEEYEERCILYERYSQYGVQLYVNDYSNEKQSQNEKDNMKASDSITSTSSMPPAHSLFRATVQLCGIADARPQLQSGDRVNIRPFKPVRHPSIPAYKEQIEIHATVVSIVRATARKKTKKGKKAKDTILVTWLPNAQSDLVSKQAMSIRFIPSTTIFDRCLAALKWLRSINPSYARELLFPSELPRSKPFDLDMSSSGDAKLQSLNPQQFQFVKMVMSRTVDPSTNFVRPPMVLTGPAGTGKTRALLMSILKVLELTPASETTTLKNMIRNRVLVCTSSHTACDVITRRLGKYLSREHIFRLYDSSRPVEMVPVELLPYTRQGRNGEFIVPTAIEEFYEFQVIVCTCSDAHILFLSGMTNASLRIRRHCFQRFVERSLEAGGLTLNGSIEGSNTPYFTHLFIDEAAQATEPETLIPMSVVVDDKPGVPKAEIALIGDPRQLSADIYSPWAMSGLNKSLLERLLRLPELGGRRHLLGPPTQDTWRTMDELIEYSLQYDKTAPEETPQLVVFLSTSYRGHHSFLHMPSKLFYFDKLRSFSREELKDAPSFWCNCVRKLESKTTIAYPCVNKQLAWPIHFRGVIGQDTSTAVEAFWGSNSWCNLEEANTVVEIVQELHANGTSTQSIGIMAAFRAQVSVIRRILRSQNLGAINVGLVEDYQAVERKVIVLTLSRSNPVFIETDVDRNAGLFRQPKRVNVALTRAEDLLVVVGNPNIMSKDPVWSPWLKYCKQHGLWYGESVTPTNVSAELNVVHDDPSTATSS